MTPNAYSGLFWTQFRVSLDLFTDLTAGKATVRTFLPRLLTAASRIQNCTYRKIITYQTPQSNLPNDCKIAVEWFGNNGMKANPTKFQIMVLSPNPNDDIELKLDENTILKPEKSVKALGVIIDNRLTFSDHISAIVLGDKQRLTPSLQNAVTLVSWWNQNREIPIYNDSLRCCKDLQQ